jgi:hypothetical protein
LIAFNRRLYGIEPARREARWFFLLVQREKRVLTLTRNRRDPGALPQKN